MLKRMLISIITAIIITSSLAVTTVYANTKTVIKQTELPPGYGIESGKVTKQLLELKLASLKDDIKTGNITNLDKKVSKLKEYLKEAVANKELNEKESEILMNEINELDKVAKMDKDTQKAKINNKQYNEIKKPKELVKTGGELSTGMLMQIGTILSVAGTLLINKLKK